MPKRLAFGKGLLRAAVSLGFFGCLVAQEIPRPEGAANEPPVAVREVVMSADWATPSFCDGSDSMLTMQVEIGLPDEFGVAFEEDDSLEVLRGDLRQCIGEIDWIRLGSRVSLKAGSYTRPNISPPLLV